MTIIIVKIRVDFYPVIIRSLVPAIVVTRIETDIPVIIRTERVIDIRITDQLLEINGVPECIITIA